jgi:dihydrofolate reductase
MRRVIESTLVSADGIIGSPPSWTGGLFGAELAARSLRQLEHTDAMLMGRGTYEMFARMWSTPTDPYGQALHDVRKIVFSATLSDPEWNGAEVARGGVADTVRALRDEGDGDLLLYGHSGVGQELLATGLLDELRLAVFPVLVGDGTPLARSGLRSALELVGTEAVENGVVIHTYRPAPTADPQATNLDGSPAP